MINRMKKLSVLALTDDVGSLLRDLMWLSSVQVEKQSGEAEEKTLSPLDCSTEKAELERRCATLDRAYRYLCPYRTDKSKIIPAAVSREAFETVSPESRQAETAAEEAIRIERDIREAEAEIVRLRSALDGLSVWETYDLPLGYGGTDKSIVVLGTVPAAVDRDRLITEADAACHGAVQIEFLTKDNTGWYLSAICHRGEERALISVLASFGFLRTSFPADAGTAKEEIERAERGIAEQRDRIESLTARTKELAVYCAEMERVYDRTASELETVCQKEKLGSTEKTVLLTGWVPEKRAERVEKVLSAYVCAYDFSDPEETDDVPVQLQNNRFATPFEAMVGLYSYPKYGTFDPTFWSAVFFSIFFGLMNADVGYGLVLTIGCLVLSRVMHATGTMKKFMQMFAISGIAGMVGGVLFGGYFGDAPTVIARELFGKEFLIRPILFNPIEDPITFFILSLALGVVHLLLGLGIKMYMLWKNGEVFSAIFDVGSWFVIFGGAGLYFLIGKAGMIVALVGVAMIVCTHGRDKKNIFLKFFSGLLGMYDLVSYMSDILSYSRILALGLSSAVIAQVFNILSTIGGRSPLTILLFPLVFVFGHVLNLALGVLGGFVHSARLQYIEFFGKFFEGGGREFRPFSPSVKYTQLDK